MSQYRKGMAGVVAGQTAISEVYGEEGRLVYRGYDIHDLAAHATFEEVAYLLWNGDLPTQTQLAELHQQMAASRTLPDGVLKTLRLFPSSAAPMDMLRTAVSRLGMEDSPQTPTLDQAVGLTAKIPTILATYHRLRQGLEPIPPRPDLSHTGNYIYMLTGKDPTPVAAESLGTYFVLLADHGFNASTFTARIVTSTASDIYSAVSAAIGALKGPLHGGAPSLVLEMLQQIGTPERAEAWMRNRLKVGPIMGIGHRIYRAEDPRNEILRELSRRVADPEFFALALHSEKTALHLVHENPRAARMYTNVEFYSAGTLHAAGLPADLFTPTFAASRTAGYTAHILEQVAEHELIRPNSEYTGILSRKVVPLAQRV